MTAQFIKLLEVFGIRKKLRKITDTATNFNIAGNTAVTGALSASKELKFTTSNLGTASDYYIGNYLTNLIYNTPTGSGHNWAINNGDKMTLTATGLAVTGLLDLSASTSGQIKFPATQNASANANTLDDYEEGTWTPVLTYGTPGTLAVTQANYGFYTKIGRQVFVQFIVRLSAFSKGTASGQLKITGLPFTVAADEQGTTVAIATYDSPFTTQPVGSASGTEIALLRLVNNSAWTVLDDPDANSQYLGQLTYHV